jgi:hypothetical protein
MNNYTLHKKYSFKKGDTWYDILRHYGVPGLTRHSLDAVYARNNQSIILDFKFSPCSESCIFSFGYFPGVRLSFADKPLKMVLTEGSETSENLIWRRGNTQKKIYNQSSNLFVWKHKVLNVQLLVQVELTLRAAGYVRWRIIPLSFVSHLRLDTLFLVRSSCATNRTYPKRLSVPDVGSRRHACQAWHAKRFSMVRWVNWNTVNTVS